MFDIANSVRLNDIWIRMGRPKSRRPSVWLEHRGKVYRNECMTIGNKATFAPKHVADLYKKWLTDLDENKVLPNNVYACKEAGALAMYEQLTGVKLIRQYKVLDYRIDGYDPVNNVAVEIDEAHHATQKKSDLIRQRKIEKALGCKFFRCNVG